MQRAIGRVEVYEGESLVGRGTCFVVTARWMLTAAHVVKHLPQAHAAVRFWDDAGEARTEGWTVPVHLVRADPDVDWAVLEVSEVGGALPPPLRLARARKGDREWRTWGFPSFRERGKGFEGKILGRADGLLELDSPSMHGAPLAGLSGAPLLVDGVAVGIVRISMSEVVPGIPERRNVAGAAFALPLEPVFDTFPELQPDPCWGLPGVPRRDDLPSRPFRYLAPYGPMEAELFAGRCREIGMLLDWLYRDDSTRILLLYGASGVGKSSLLHAGFFPRLGGALVEYQRWGPDVARMVVPAGTLLLLDQVEDGLKGTPAVADVLDRHIGGRLILSFRKEHLAELQDLLDHRRVAYERVFVAPLGQAQAEEVVRHVSCDPRLKQRYKLGISDEVIEELTSDLSADPESPVGPMLQVALSQLWDQAYARRPSAPEVTIELYREVRAQGLGMADFLENQRRMFRQAHPTEAALGLDLDLLALHMDGRDAARAVSSDERLTSFRHVRHIEACIDTLKSLRLLSEPTGEQVATAGQTRLAHDTLGPEVRRAIEASIAPGPRARRLVRSRELEGRDLDAADLALVTQGEGGGESMDGERGRADCAQSPERSLLALG